MAKNIKAYRRPSLFLAALLLSEKILALVPTGPDLCTKGFAARGRAQIRSPKRTVRSRKPRVDQWFIFKGPDGEFTLAFPEKPALKQVEEGPITIVRSYEVTSQDGLVFSVNFQDIGGDPNAPESNEWITDLEAKLAAADRAQNVQVIQTHRLAKNIIESELLLHSQINGTELHSLRRNILRRARVYTLGCGSVIDKKPVDKNVCERFFHSIKFVGAK